MTNSSEPSSSLSFTSASLVSNGSICQNTVSSSGTETVSSLEVISLHKLSSNLEQLLIDSSCDYTDADILVEDIPIGVHRCILASRSKFFHELFKSEKGSHEKEGKRMYNIKDHLPYGKIGYEAFLIFLSYVYTGKLKLFPMEVSTCVDKFCAHDGCGPAISFVVELMYASSISQIPELVTLFQRRMLNFVGKALVEDVLQILVAAYHCQLNQLVTECADRVARSDIETFALEKELPEEVAEKIKTLRLKKVKNDSEHDESVEDPMDDKRIRRIHKALDSDDVELMNLLLSESEITLDEAKALHYAAAYCDPKVLSEVLSLGIADVNLRNSRGYTVLHIAAMRKEPSIIVTLLRKGACALDLTMDDRSAVTISRRLTRPKDYHAKTEQGQEAVKDRLCIDVLEREMWRNPFVVDSSISSQTITDDLQTKLFYLENRVAFARILFPTEASVAMDIANAETTSGLSGYSVSKGSSGNLREVDLNETPVMQNKRLRSRMETLMKTVQMGRRFFPNCSEVLDKFMDDDLPDLLYLEKGNLNEQKIKRKRYRELKDDVQKAFNKDKAESNRSKLSSPASSLSLKDGINHTVI